MKIAGVVIDAYKLDIFKKHLDAGGYKYTQHDGPKPGTLTLRVEYEWVESIQPVIQAANDEAKRKGK